MIQPTSGTSGLGVGWSMFAKGTDPLSLHRQIETCLRACDTLRAPRYPAALTRRHTELRLSSLQVWL